ncbi:hypothetical protein OESDEN_06975 [Oesophagostomum dentatum]|uniref:Uncharacterized protein n=1 Tax=Oesophagostomum dentatum TaxID=61180 RepID=A0A0B1T7B2_OESDE|nr:hypothetical protein OESDEN_06975 [Oesophagostomum dentatum]
MKLIFLTVGLLGIAATAFAEEEVEKVENKDLSETGLAVLEKLRALREEEEHALESIENDQDREIINSILKTEIEADDAEVAEAEDSVRVKRAIRRRGRARRGRGRGRRRAAARRRFYRRLRRNQRRAARKRIAHARRHRQNVRRAANRIRRLQG